MNTTTTITIVLAKEVFQVAVFPKFGKQVINKAVNSKKLQLLVIQYPGASIYMEACGSAHYWGRRFTQLGQIVTMKKILEWLKPILKHERGILIA